MVNYITCPLKKKDYNKVIRLIKKTRYFLTVLGLIGLLWASGPQQYINAMNSIPQFQEVVTFDNSIDFEENSTYPTTTDSDFNMSDVEVEYEEEGKRTSTSKTFQKIDGTYETVFYNQDIHFLEDGTYTEIDNSFWNDGSEIGNNSNKYKIKFPKTLHESKSIKLSYDDYKISWKISGASSTDATYTEGTEKSNNLKDVVNINSSVKYSSVLDDVDLEYQLKGTDIKENIILNSYIENFSMTFEYKLTGLNLIEDFDGNIVFMNNDNEVVTYFNSLYMIDSNEVYSDQVSISFIETGYSTYEVTVRPNDTWLKGASFPVVVDPSLTFSESSTYVDRRFVYTDFDTNNSGYDTQGNLQVGYNSNYNETHRSYLSFDFSNIPDDMQITYATIALQDNGTKNCTDKCTLLLKEVQSNYSISSISQINDNYTIDDIVDYEILYHDDNQYTNYYFDASSTFQKWMFNNRTNGIFELRMKDETTSNSVVLIPVDGSVIKPILEIGLVDINGVKNHWTYNEQPVGQAGSGLISDYTGQLHFNRTDAYYSTELQTLALSFVYNNSKRDIDYGYGLGWQTNYNITLQFDTITEQFYMTDSTGSSVYFVTGESPTDYCDDRFDDGSSKRCYLAEDGSNDLLIVTEVSNYPEEYKIVTQSQTEYSFSFFDETQNGIGYLKEIKDTSSSQELSISIIYDEINNEFARIKTVTDSSGNTIQLNYIDHNADGDKLDVVDYLYSTYMYTKDETGSLNGLTKNLYSYDTTSLYGERLLKDVILYMNYDKTDTYTKEHKSSYTYTVDQIKTVKSSYYNEQLNEILSSQIHYTYTGEKVFTVESYKESTLIGDVEYSYDFKKTTITNHKDETLTYYFDDYGHTVQILDNNGYSQVFRYVNIFTNVSYDIAFYEDFRLYRNYRYNHRLIYKSNPEVLYLDPIIDGGFEDDSIVPWILTVDNLGQGTYSDAMFSYAVSSSKFGSSSLESSFTATNMKSHLDQTVTLDKGTYYLQGYILNDAITGSDQAYLAVEGHDSSGDQIEYIPVSQDWTHTSLRFTVQSDATNVTIKLVNHTGGTVYFDGISLSNGYTNTTSNLINNSSFEFSTYDWSCSSANFVVRAQYPTNIKGDYANLIGNYGLKITGDEHLINHATTDISSYLDLNNENTYTLSLWGYSLSTPFKKDSNAENSQGSFMRAEVQFYVNNIEIEDTGIELYFDQDINGWQQLTTDFTIPKYTTSVTITLEYIGIGTVYFDGLSIEEGFKGVNYNYDHNGYISSTQSSKELTKYYYEEDSEGRPLSSVPISVQDTFSSTNTPLNENSLPEYYENNNIRVTPTYDSYNRTTETKVGNASNYYKTKTTFGTNQFSQFVTSQTDPFGNDTTYDYNLVTGLLDKITNANQSTIQYEYYEDGLLHKVVNCEDESTDEYCPVTEYVYDSNNRLSKIIMNSTYDYYYLLEYDLDRISAVTIKGNNGNYSNTLMTYDYEVSNGYEANRLSMQKYGNDDEIHFTYNSDEQLSEISYGPSKIKRFSYVYDQRGLLSEMSTYQSDGTVVSTEYYSYDVQGNLVNILDNDGNSISYDYDDLGNCSGITYNLKDGSTTYVDHTVNYDHYNESPVNVLKDLIDEREVIGADIDSTGITPHNDFTTDKIGDSISISTTTSKGVMVGGLMNVYGNSPYQLDINVTGLTGAFDVNVYEYTDFNIENINFLVSSAPLLSNINSSGQYSTTFTTHQDAKYIIITLSSATTFSVDISDFILDHSGPEDSKLYDATSYQTIDGNAVLKDYSYESLALQRLDNIQLTNGVFSITENFDYVSYTGYSSNTTRLNQILYIFDYNDDGIQDKTLKYEYNYDDLGNITTIKEYINGTLTTYDYYEYDSLNQMVLEDHKSASSCTTTVSDDCFTKIYNYDERGNITTVKLYPFEERETVLSYPAQPDYYWNYSGSTIALSGSWGSWDDLYSLSLNQTPNTNVTFYNPSTLMPYNSTTTLISSDLDTSQAGYYSSLYESRVNRFTIIRWKIIYKVGTPTPVEVTNYPYREYEYTYSTDWLDQLESINTYRYENSVKVLDSYGYAYNYDDQGNPTTIYHFVYDGITYDHAILEYTGRQLDSIMIQDSSNTTLHTIQYTYNDQGYRTTKIVDGVRTTYHLQGDKVLVEETGNEVIVYTYDYNGTLISMNYDNDITDQTSGTEYYYITNQQGDITKLVDNNGHVVVEYTYDAWGNILSTTDSTNSNISEINPYRYRGYRHDDETGLYYLNSRYYDSNTGRFINSDGLLGPQGNTLSHNLFAYCGNNPVMYIDMSGESPVLLFLTISAILLFTPVGGATAQIVTSVLSYIGMSVWALGDLIVNNGNGAWADMNRINWNPFNSDESKVFSSNRISFYKGSPVFLKNSGRSGAFYAISLNKNANHDTLRHEKGHCYQSMMMGIATYGITVGLPSWQKYGLCSNPATYYNAPWETTADILGGVKGRTHTQSEISNSWWYYGGSHFIIPSFFQW